MDEIKQNVTSFYEFLTSLQNQVWTLFPNVWINGQECIYMSEKNWMFRSLLTSCVFKFLSQLLQKTITKRMAYIDKIIKYSLISILKM